MLEPKLRTRAQRDVDEIWDYTQEHWSADQADRYVNQIREAVMRLCGSPEMGRPVEYRIEGLRKLGAGSHIIFYRVDGNILDIVRILHQSMDFPQHL